MNSEQIKEQINELREFRRLIFIIAIPIASAEIAVIASKSFSKYFWLCNAGLITILICAFFVITTTIRIKNLIKEL